jgi:hypothetical protein
MGRILKGRIRLRKGNKLLKEIYKEFYSYILLLVGKASKRIENDGKIFLRSYRRQKALMARRKWSRIK